MIVDRQKAIEIATSSRACVLLYMNDAGDTHCDWFGADEDHQVLVRDILDGLKLSEQKGDVQ